MYAAIVDNGFCEMICGVGTSPEEAVGEALKTGNCKCSYVELNDQQYNAFLTGVTNWSDLQTANYSA